MGDGAFSGTLAADSSNIVTLVEDLYNVSPLSHFFVYEELLSFNSNSYDVYT